MYNNKSINYTSLRKKAGRLYNEVLTKKRSIQNALADFPKDSDDKTIIAAWHALCHLEADEDIRRKDILYKQEQDEYIEYIMFTLQKGEPLPENIVNAYAPYHQDALIPNSTKLKGIIHTFKKFLC